MRSVAWTGDSQTIVIVGHIAGGSEASIIRFENGAWVQHPAEPQDGDEYEVVRQVLRKHTVELTYEISARSNATKDKMRFYLYTFLLDSATGKHSNERRNDVDPETYVALQPKIEFDYNKP